MATALEKISNKGIIGAAGIPGSDKGFASFMTRRHEGLRKMREENELGTWEIMFYKLSGMSVAASRKSGAISQATSTRPSGKMNDMKTCWHVEVYSNSRFGLIAPTTKQD